MFASVVKLLLVGDFGKLLGQCPNIGLYQKDNFYERGCWN